MLSNLQGIVFEVAADGLSGKIVAFKDCTEGGQSYVGPDWGETYVEYSWGPTLWTDISGKAPFGTNDGSATMQALKDKNLLSSFPAFAACAALGDEWYLPASEELSLLLSRASEIDNVAANYGGTNLLDVEAYWSSSLKSRTIYYYDQVDAIDLVTTPVTKQSEIHCGVRAIAQFVSE